MALKPLQRYLRTYEGWENLTLTIELDDKYFECCVNAIYDHWNATLNTMPNSEFGADITMLLVGQTGHGKSATGNSILGRKAFVSKHSPGSVTDVITRAVAVKNGRRIEIVDSPGFADQSKGKEFVEKNLMQAVYQTLPGFNAIVFVLNPERFTDELVKTVNLFFEFFGEGVGKFAFILFTHTKSKAKINEYVRNAGENPTDNVQVLLDLIERCGRKVMYIDNDKKEEKKHVMVDEIIRTIDANRVRLGQEHFTNKVFKEAIKSADRFIHENNPTKGLEGDNANDIVNMRNKSEGNKPEKDTNNKDILERKERMSRWREQFEGRRTSVQTKSSHIHPDGAQRLAHQNVNATDQNSVQKPTSKTKAQNESTLEEIKSSGNDSSPELKSGYSGKLYQDLNKKLLDGIKRVDVEQQCVDAPEEPCTVLEEEEEKQSSTASVIETEVPGRRYDTFKDKVINDKVFFELVFEVCKKCVEHVL